MGSFVLLATVSLSAPPLADGTLVYLINSNKVVARTTESEITHVALALNEGSTSWVYEATPGKVRRTPLADYAREVADLNQRRTSAMQMWVMPPRQPFLSNEVVRMRHHLKQQLGRRYSVRSYVRDRPGDGIHCAELTAATLQLTGRVDFDSAHRQTPDSLVREAGFLYAAPRQLPLPALQREGWCRSTWKCWSGFRQWCAWSCWEAFTFCR